MASPSPQLGPRPDVTTAVSVEAAEDAEVTVMRTVVDVVGPSSQEHKQLVSACYDSLRKCVKKAKGNPPAKCSELFYRI
jgi:hypothetical protein